MQKHKCKHKFLFNNRKGNMTPPEYSDPIRAKPDFLMQQKHKKICLK